MSVSLAALDDLLRGGSSWWEVAATWVSVVGIAVGLGIALVPPLGRLAVPPLRRTKLSEYVLFDKILSDGRTLRSRNGTLSVAIELAGLDYSGANEEVRYERRDRRRQMFQLLSEIDVHVRVFDLRERVPASPPQRRPARGNAAGLALRSRVVGRWEAQFKRAYRNRHVVVLSVRGNGDDARARLERARAQVWKALEDFQPMDLGEVGLEEGSHPASTLLEFWGHLVSRVTRPSPVGRLDVARLVAVDSVDLNPDSGLMIHSHGQSKAYAQVITLSSWGGATPEELVARLQALDGELLVLNAAYVHSEMGGTFTLDQLERGAASTWVSQQAAAEFLEVKEMIAPNSRERERLVRHALTVFAFGDSPDEAARVQKQVEAVFQTFHAETVVERDLAGVLWWSMLPGWEDWSFIREVRAVCQNVADLVVFETPKAGLPRSGWGSGAGDSWILRALTASGTPYYVNLHETAKRDALAHTIIFGRTGSGKTTVADLLVIGALEHFPGLIATLFDSRFGQYVATTMCGGRYVSLLSDRPGGETDAQLQPLQRPPTTAVRAHLAKLFRLLTGLSDPDSERMYQKAVNALVRMESAGTPMHERTLATVVEAGFDPGSPAFTQMQRWLPGGTYGSVFSGTERVPIGESDLLAFDFTTVLKDPVLAPPLVEDVAYLVTERVRREGRGGIILIDETAALWSSDEFLKNGIDWMQQVRKDFIAVMTLWQRPSSLSEIHPNLPKIMRSQTATWIFHPDRGAKYADYEEWLTPEEFAFVDGSDRSYDHMEHPVLLKKPNAGESAVLEFSTAALGDLACCFASDVGCVERARHLKDWDPVDWRDAYLDEFGTERAAS